MSAVISTIFAPASDSPKDIPRQHADDALKRTGASASSTVGLRRHCPRWYRCRPRSKKRSEEHTSELQSRGHLVCRLLLEKKKSQIILDMGVLDFLRPQTFSAVRQVIEQL